MKLYLKSVLTYPILLIIGISGVTAQMAIPEILPLRVQAEIENEWLGIRLETVVPTLMERENIDMWILIASEYNEDPVVLTMLPATWIAARRTTMLVIARNTETSKIDRWAVARYGIGTYFERAWDPDSEPDQYKRLAEIVKKYNPERIGINTSQHFHLANGLTHTEYKKLVSALGDEFTKRLVSAESLAIGWLETRIPEEMELYPVINRIAHKIVMEGLSNAAVTPGVTTTDDLAWWYRERIRELGLVTWFHPWVSIQRQQDNAHDGDFSDHKDSEIIQPGDLLHVDVGITYLRLNTDTQRMAYVLKPGERVGPDWMIKAFANGNRLQDILTSNFKTGLSGNEILRLSLEKGEKEGLNPVIYTHPLGFHGHGAGPTIGLWDQQGGVPGKGDYPLFPNTAHSIELMIKYKSEAWDGQEVLIMLEEDAFFDGKTVTYIDGRQEALYLIKSGN